MNHLNIKILIIFICCFSYSVYSRPIELGPVEISTGAFTGVEYFDNYTKSDVKESAHTENLGGRLNVKYANEHLNFGCNAMAGETYRSYTDDTNEIYRLTTVATLSSTKGFYIGGEDTRFKTNESRIYETNAIETKGHKYGYRFGFLNRDKPYKFNLSYDKTDTKFDGEELSEKYYTATGTYKFAYHYGISIYHSELFTMDNRIQVSGIGFAWDFSETESLNFGLRILRNNAQKNWGLKIAYKKLFFYDLKTELRLSRSYFPAGYSAAFVRNVAKLMISKPLFLESTLMSELSYDYSDADDSWALSYALYNAMISFQSPITESFAYVVEFNYEAKRDSDDSSNVTSGNTGNYDANSVEFKLFYIF